jgi:hypothetical protein
MVSDLTTGVFFYVRVLDEKPLALFRLDVDTDRKEINETIWDGSSWQETNRLTMYIGYGSTEVEQVLERDATLAFPDAFRDLAPNFKRIIPSVMSKHLEHDQKTHGRGGGRASTLDPDSVFGAPFATKWNDEKAELDVDEAGMQSFLETNSLSAPVTAMEMSALSSYQGNGYEDINLELRMEMMMGDSVLSPENKQKVDLIDSAVSKGKFSEDVIVFRGVDDSDGVFTAEGVGAEITDFGFQSTTVSVGIGAGFAGAQYSANQVVMRIKVPAGSPALSVDKARGAKSYTEMEVLLPRRTVYRITGIQSDVENPFTGTNTTLIDMEVVP